MNTPRDHIAAVTERAPKVSAGETGFGWRWSLDAKRAFMEHGVVGKGRIKVSEGMNAAMLVDGTDIFALQLRGFLQLRGADLEAERRTLLLKNADGAEIALKCDTDLLMFLALGEVKDDEEIGIISTPTTEGTADGEAPTQA